MRNSQKVTMCRKAAIHRWERWTLQGN